ncbi:MAG TPA: hypothetical protein VHO70_01670, partial [Chitinispirillaceae bacterium]|nr:hypothetical protein [Chitinispirillaceae bacterium]
GYNHDGTLFSSLKEFLWQSAEINRFIGEWGVTGFSSPSMFHNLDWMHQINISYDISTFDTDPFEPQPDGAGTIFPFIVKDSITQHTYVELPYTLCQDFTLFIIMEEKDISIWKKKLDWIARHGGMALVNTHPDYMNFDNRKCSREEYHVSLYEELLTYVQTVYKEQYWHAKPMEVAAYVKKKINNSVPLNLDFPSPGLGSVERVSEGKLHIMTDSNLL